MRVLLRSLLRLHHVRVDGEAQGTKVALDLVRRLHPSIVLVDELLNDGAWTELLLGTRTNAPHARFVLVAPRPPSTPDGHRPDALLVRPFRIRAFADALALPDPPGPSPPSA